MLQAGWVQPDCRSKASVTYIMDRLLSCDRLLTFLSEDRLLTETGYCQVTRCVLGLFACHAPGWFRVT